MNVKYFNNAQVQQNPIIGSQQQPNRQTDRQTDNRPGNRHNSINWSRTSGSKGNQGHPLRLGRCHKQINHLFMINSHSNRCARPRPRQRSRIRFNAFFCERNPLSRIGNCHQFCPHLQVFGSISPEIRGQSLLTIWQVSLANVCRGFACMSYYYYEGAYNLSRQCLPANTNVFISYLRIMTAKGVGQQLLGRYSVTLLRLIPAMLINSLLSQAIIKRHVLQRSSDLNPSAISGLGWGSAGVINTGWPYVN